MGSCRLWYRVTVVSEEGSEVDWNVGGAGRPTMQAVDTVARLALLARRGGASIRLSEVAPEMRELLDLAGLTLEVPWQAEGGKDPLGVQEGVESGDPPP